MEESVKIKIRNTLLLNELKTLDTIFYQQDITAAVIKGTALLLKGYFKNNEREMTDIDIMINEKDFNTVCMILEKNDYKKIPKGRHAYYKIIGNKFAPVIFDVHTYFSNFNLNDLELENISNYLAFKIPSDKDLLIITAIHSIIKHAFFDDKTLKDFKVIYENGQKNDDNLEENVITKACKYNTSYILWLSFKKTAVNLKRPNISFKEFFSLPFVLIAFYVHIKLNEYILPFFYEFKKVKEKITKLTIDLFKFSAIL